MSQYCEKNIFTFTWRIENFSMCPQKNGEFIRSPEFVVNMLEKTKWYLRLFPKGEEEADDSCVSCFLCRISKQNEPEDMKICFYIALGSNDVQQLYDPTAVNTIGKFRGTGYSPLISLEQLREGKHLYLPNDVLTVKCSMIRGTETSTEMDPVDNSFLCPTYLLTENSIYTSDINVSTEQWFENCSSYTRIPVYQKVIKLVIKNFKKQTETGRKIPFLVESTLREESALILHCYTIGGWDSDGSVRIDIQRKGREFKQMLLRCEVSLLDSKDLVQQHIEGEHLFGEDYEIWFFPPVVKLSTIEIRKEELLHCGTLKLRCKFSISYKGEDISIGNIPKNQKLIDTDDSYFNVTNPTNDGEINVVTLISNGARFPVHKSIICASSPVFRAMFESDTREKQTGVVHITDIDTDTLRHLIFFMYYDRKRNLQPEDAMKLYLAADKYDILKLKEECAAFLKSNLTTTNVCDVLVLADMHHDTDLLNSVHNFLRFNLKEIFESMEWTNLMVINHKLAGETMKKLLLAQSISKS